MHPLLQYELIRHENTERVRQALNVRLHRSRRVRRLAFV
jgi:hypothetical protein